MYHSLFLPAVPLPSRTITTFTGKGNKRKQRGNKPKRAKTVSHDIIIPSEEGKNHSHLKLAV